MTGLSQTAVSTPPLVPTGMAGGNPGAQWAVGVVRGEPGEERVSHRGIGGPDRSAEESALLIDEESRHANDARILGTGKQKVIAPDVDTALPYRTQAFWGEGRQGEHLLTGLDPRPGEVNQATDNPGFLDADHLANVAGSPRPSRSSSMSEENVRRPGRR